MCLVLTCAATVLVLEGLTNADNVGACFRNAAALGGKPETLAGLSGLGDLILSCGSEKSRNFAYGAALARGEDLSNRPLAEGVFTASVAAKLARDHGLDAPIISAVDAILDGRITVLEAMDGLMSRPLKTET